MKGIVFNMLGDMVEQEFGMDVWDDLIDATAPESEGIYTSVEVYPDAELLAYVAEIARYTGADVADVVRAFGRYMLGRFAEIHPEFFDGHSVKSFLKSVEEVIHVEVRKLHPDVVLPNFICEDTAADALVMHYHSPRALCYLAEGLIEGAAAHFEQEVVIAHPVCMHRGGDHCVLDLRFSTGDDRVDV